MDYWCLLFKAWERYNAIRFVWHGLLSSQRERGDYLIVRFVNYKEILELMDSFGVESQQVKEYVDNYLKFMYKQWYHN